MLLLNNPCVGDIRQRFRQELSNPWVAGAFVSTLQVGEVLALDLDDQLIGLSAFLRTDYTAQEFRQLKVKVNLDDAFSLFELERPCRALGEYGDSPAAERFHSHPTASQNGSVDAEWKRVCGWWSAKLV